MNSRVKVSTEKLLDAVKARRAVIVADHEKAVDEFRASQATKKTSVVNGLRVALAAARKGDLPEIDNAYREGYYAKVPIDFTPLHDPGKQANVHQIDRLIRTLEMASEPTMSISADDAAQYLG